MDTDDVRQLLKEVSDELIRPRFRALAQGQVMEKNPGDLVTVADQEAELAIGSALRAAYPEAAILGEEAYATNPDLLAQFTAAAHGFTIDPVDGTRNFVHGSPDYAVMVSEQRHGETVRAWIWQPEHNLAYVAERGAGLSRNGQPLVWAPSGRRSIRGIASVRSWVGRELPGLGTLELTWVSCGIDYPHLIEGDADFAIYWPAQAWDHLPGALMVTESGGFVSTLAGSPYDVGSAPDAGVVVARDAELGREVVGAFHAQAWRQLVT